MAMIFPLPKRYLAGFSTKNVRISALASSCPVSFGAKVNLTTLNYQHDDSLPKQGYRIRIANGCLLVDYSDLHGIRYAHLAINQLVEKKAVLREDIIIEDWPDFPTRSVLVDISRDRVPTMATLKRLIEYFSHLRFNQLQLYTEHTFAYQKHSLVWADYSPMTSAEIREIDAYCQSLGIELVANQACFGHMEKWLNHPEYHHLAEQTSGFTDQRGDFREGAFGLNPISPQTEIFIDELFSELLPNFSTNTININFDETMDLGENASKSACDIFGKGKVYLTYLNKIIDLAKSKGKQCQIFSDMLFRYPNLIEQLPNDLILLNWGYEPEHPFDAEHKQLALFGYPFHVVVSTDCYASVSGRWHAAISHMRNAAKSAKRFGAEGYMVTEWGDMGHGQQFAMPIPAYAFGAAMAWGEEQQLDSDVSQAVRWFYPDAKQVEIDALIALQDIYLATGVQTPNCAFFGPVLFDQLSRRHIKRATGIKSHTLDIAMTELAEWRQKLKPLRASELTPDLLWTIDALEIACEIVQGYADEHHRQIEDFSEERKSLLRPKIQMLLDTYRQLWTEYYRPGGMNQSSARLSYLLSLLDESPTTQQSTEAVH
ncbi:family 20 glycosylhydrolase [Enterovibrio calviensis]|uniref:family 20 glycosylhydrolase n=1 Tax=Enterovibrio calviensis TaxID=91359 RepID=UPI000488CB4D|nr:family 20 glycosylhydrolase [Enterovibrio calviensis]